MRKTAYLLCVVLVLCAAGISLAQGVGMSSTTRSIATSSNSSSLAKENADLKSRLDQLDKEIAEIKKSISEQTGTAPGQKPVWSNLGIQLYGYIKLDAAYDSSRIDNGNYAKWVESEQYNDNDSQFSMTANETRLGMLINGKESDGIRTSGKVEVDFYGSGDGENKPHLMLRHAFLKVEWPEKKFDIIAGQTSDVISPLVLPTLNYSVGWWTGNIGYRRPQIRLTKQLNFAEGGSLKLEGALARTIGRLNGFVSGTIDSGRDAGFPTVQGRASVTIKTFGPEMATIGVSGHIGKEEYDTTATGDNKKFDTWSVNVDYTQPVCDKLSIKAEMFSGENLDAYLGGIGQGVTLTGAKQYKEIGSKGGWIAASLGPWCNKRFNVGLAMDNVDRGDINTGDRLANRSLFGNIICSLNEQTDVGFELSHWRTEYKGPGDGDAMRAQLALTYKF